MIISRRYISSSVIKASNHYYKANQAACYDKLYTQPSHIAHTPKLLIQYGEAKSNFFRIYYLCAR